MNNFVQILLTFSTSLLIAIPISAQDDTAQSQSQFAAGTYFELFGSLDLISVHIEGGIDNPFDSSIVRSIRASVGIGAPFFAAFAPVRLKILLGYEHCAEIGVGILYQYRLYVSEPTFIDWSDTRFNPNIMVAYRYEPYTSGILYRVSIDAAKDPPNNRYVGTIGFSIGWRF
jgi:hypothetical protein